MIDVSALFFIRESLMNPYEILGLDRSATLEDIKAAYRHLAKQHHPDKGGDATRFTDISEAFSLLSDSQRRARYDQTGDTSRPTQEPPESLEVLSILAEIIKNIIIGDGDLSRVDVVAQVTSNLDRVAAKRESMIRHLKSKRQRAEQLLERLKLKEDSPDLLAGSVRFQLLAIDTDIAREEEGLRINDRVRAVWERYQYDFEQGRPTGTHFHQRYVGSFDVTTSGGTTT